MHMFVHVAQQLRQTSISAHGLLFSGVSRGGVTIHAAREMR